MILLSDVLLFGFTIIDSFDIYLFVERQQRREVERRIERDRVRGRESARE